MLRRSACDGHKDSQAFCIANLPSGAQQGRRPERLLGVRARVAAFLTVFR
jgi:hypothetical protein